MLKTIATGTIKISSPIGLAMPSDFPMAEYESLLKHVRNAKRNLEINGAVLDQFLGGWNAVAYRFRATAEHDESFVRAIEEPADHTIENRYVEERELFGFFVTGLSVIESIGYATFSIGSIINTSHFPLETERQRRDVDPERLALSLRKYHSAESISDIWRSFLQTGEFREWKRIRNTLAHRTSPPRLVTDSATINFQTGETTDKTVTAEWKDFEIPIDRTTTSKRRGWLAERTKQMLQAADSFAAYHL